MYVSSLEHCRSSIKKLDFKIVELLSYCKYETVKEEIINQNIEKINKDIIDDVYNSINLDFKINYNIEIKNLIIYLLHYITIPGDEYLDDLTLYISKRVYIGHYVAEFKFTNNSTKFANKSKNEIFELITNSNIELMVLSRINEYCIEHVFEKSYEEFIQLLYNKFLIRFNKDIQVNYIFMIN